MAMGIITNYADMILQQFAVDIDLYSSATLQFLF